MNVPSDCTFVRAGIKTFRTVAKAKAARCACNRQATVAMMFGNFADRPQDIAVCPACAARFVVEFLERLAAQPVAMRPKVSKPINPATKAALDEVRAETAARVAKSMAERGLTQIIPPPEGTDLEPKRFDMAAQMAEEKGK